MLAMKGNQLKLLPQGLFRTNERKQIDFTEPYFHPLEKFISYLEQKEGKNGLTNKIPIQHGFKNGLVRLSRSLKHFSLFANGTIALVTALQAVRFTGEVIIT